MVGCSQPTVEDGIAKYLSDLAADDAFSGAVLVAKDGEIEEGIIIDPWRDPGELYFVKVGDDPDYVWHHRPKRGCY